MNTQYSNPTESSEQSIFDEEPYLVQASRGKRFLNLIIDSISYSLFMMIVWGGLSLIFTPVYEFAMDLDKNPLADRLLGMVLFGVYMSMMEVITRGRTLGKLITGTVAVTETGETPSVKQLFIRGISRCVPFEAFSGLGDPSYPWHDRWSETEVIDLKKSKR